MATSPGALIVLGIDPGIATTGYGLLRSYADRLDVLAFGVIAPAAQLSKGEKLEALYGGLTAVITRWRPQEVAVEDFVVGHARAAVVIGEARAMALLAAAEAGLPVTLYKPAQVKQSVAAYGRGSKAQVAEMVRALLGMEETPQPEDAADALAVALCHCLKREAIPSPSPSKGEGRGEGAPSPGGREDASSRGTRRP